MSDNLAKKLFSKGLAFFKKREYDEAARIFNEILTINPRNINSLIILSQIYKIKNNNPEYEVLLKKIIKLDENNYQSLNNLALLYKENNFIEKAEFYFKKTIEKNSNYSKAVFNLALLYEEKGNLKGAEDLYKKALEIEFLPSIYFNIIRIDQNYIDKINLDQIKHICESNENNLKEKAYAYFILAIKERREKNIDNEIKYLELGHQLFMNSDKIYLKSNNYWIDKIPKIFLKKLKYSKIQNKENNLIKLNPIFVVGLPRSGTTLVESLISSQKKIIKNYGETSVIPQSVGNFLLTKYLNDNKINLTFIKKDIIEGYNKFINSNTNAPITFVDKTLENIFFLDIIQKIFPKSKIIICKRDYFHNFVAIFQQCLAGLPWTHNKDSVLKYIINFNLILRKIRKLRSNNILCVNLSELTNSPLMSSKKIFKFCNLEWDKSVLKFYERDDLVIKTASNIQIRKEIFKYDSSKFKEYEKPFRKYFNKINTLKN